MEGKNGNGNDNENIKKSKNTRRRRRRLNEDGDSNSDGDGIRGHSSQIPENSPEVLRPSRDGDADGVNVLPEHEDLKIKKKPLKSAMSHKKASAKGETLPPEVIIPQGEGTVKLKLKPKSESSVKIRTVKKSTKVQDEDAQFEPKLEKDKEFETDTETERPKRIPKKVRPKISISEFVPKPKPKSERWKYFKDSVVSSLIRQYERLHSRIVLDFSKLWQQQQREKQRQRKKRSTSKSGTHEENETSTATAADPVTLSDEAEVEEINEDEPKSPVEPVPDPALKLKTQKSSQPKQASKSAAESRTTSKKVSKFNLREQIQKSRAERGIKDVEIRWAWGFVIKNDPIRRNRPTFLGLGAKKSRPLPTVKPPSPSPPPKEPKYSAAEVINRVKANAGKPPAPPEPPRVNPYMPPPLNFDFLQVAQAQARTLEPLSYWDREINRSAGAGPTLAHAQMKEYGADEEYYPSTAFTSQFAHLLPRSHQYIGLDEFGLERKN